MTNIQRNVIRIPNLPLGQIVKPDGTPTDEEQTFRQALLTLLEQIAGNEGLVMPVQTEANVIKIQNHTTQTPDASTFTYTCAFGTMLYQQNDDDPVDVAKDEFVVAFNSGGTPNKPFFKQVLVIDTQTLEPSAGSVAGYIDVTFLGLPYKIALYAPS
jgi:hypothetical protein